MRKVLFFLGLLCLVLLKGQAQPFIDPAKDPAKAWFPAAKQGLFIHWLVPKEDERDTTQEVGSPAYHQWSLSRGKKFTAAKYKPEEWARLAKSWGMKYAVLTTKHHIGFALYDYPKGTFTAAKHSPAKKYYKGDIVGDYARAMRKEGIKVGLYYSLPDRNHPDYASVVIDPVTKTIDPAKSDMKRWRRFTDYMLDELRHILTAYGPIDLIWFDGDWERPGELWRSEEIYALCRQLQPHMVINNRLRHARIGDYATPESTAPLHYTKADWFEFCYTLYPNWDLPSSTAPIKPAHEVVRINGDIWQQGGNVLINVAPDSTGTIDPRQLGVLNAYAPWAQKHAEAIYDTKTGLPLGLFNGGSTTRDSTLYLFAYELPHHGELVLKGCEAEIKSITHLATGQVLTWRESGGFAGWGARGWLYINLPANLADPYATVVKVTFKGKGKFKTPQDTVFSF